MAVAHRTNAELSYEVGHWWALELDRCDVPRELPYRTAEELGMAGPKISLPWPRRDDPKKEKEAGA